jgi:PAS domain S-box-containing protein
MRRLLQFLDLARSFFVPRHHGPQEADVSLRAIFDCAPVGITVYDLHGRLLRANPAYQRMSGFTEAELLLESDACPTEPEEFPRSHDMLQELMAGKRNVYTVVRQCQARNGTALWLRSNVWLVRDKDGTPRHLVATSEDMAQRWLRKELVHERAEPFDLLVASVSDYAIFILDPEGRIKSWNVGAERIKGYRAEEVIGRHFSCFYPRQEVEQGIPARELQEAKLRGRFENEGWRLRKDGSAFWANVIITPMRDAAGKLYGFAKVTRDLTDRRQLEERLRDNEARLRAFLDHSPAVIFMKDLDGRYLHANAQFAARFGLGGRTIIGNTDTDLFPAAQAAAFRANDQKVLADGAPLEFEEIAQYADGPHTSMVSKFPLRDSAGKITGIGGIATDITERKRTERELKEYAGQLRVLSQRLVEVHEDDHLDLSRELHDRVGQNLTALGINLGIVLSQLSDAVTPSIASRLRDSQQLVVATVDSITDVMADLRPPLLDDYGPLPALQAIADQFVRRTGIDVQVHGPAHLDRLPQQVELSLCRIAQEALTNLAKHAHARHVRIEIALPPERITLAIADDGIGFDPATLNRRGGRGGWGMLTMRERAVALGGTLTIESGPGRGTRVTVTLAR